MWRFVGSCFDGDPFAIDGMNVWCSWAATGERAVVTDPLYPWQIHDLAVWTMTGAERVVEFAAGELSNGVWGFWVRDLVRSPNSRAS